MLCWALPFWLVPSLSRRVIFVVLFGWLPLGWFVRGAVVAVAFGDLPSM